MNFPLITHPKRTWSYMVFAYIFLAAVLPMWLLMQPRDLHDNLYVCRHDHRCCCWTACCTSDNEPADVTPVSTMKNPVTCSRSLFVTVACGAVSGFHSLVSSGTSSKTISNEKDMQKVGYGAMVFGKSSGCSGSVCCRCRRFC